MTSVREDEDLAEVLVTAQREDIDVLVDILTDNGKGRLFLSNESRDTLCTAKDQQAYSEEVLELIAHLIQWYGGNTLANLCRKGKGVAYRVLLEGVADNLKIRLPKETHVAELERAVITSIFQKAWSWMSPDERAATFEFIGQGAAAGEGPLTADALQRLLKTDGGSTYRLAMGVANAMSMRVTGHGVPLVPVLVPLLGPIGAAISAVWTMADLSAPSYRVTVPCVVQIAYMRQKRLVRACPKCAAANSREAKFCSNCGHQF